MIFICKFNKKLLKSAEIYVIIIQITVDMFIGSTVFGGSSRIVCGK